MEFNSFLLYGVPVIALIMALVKAAREFGLPSKFAPLLSILLGILFGLLVSYQNGAAPVAGAVIGLVAGLSACGLYDAAKFTIIEEVEETME